MGSKFKEIKEQMKSITDNLDPASQEVVFTLEEYATILEGAGKPRAAKRIGAAVKIVNDLIENRYNPPVRTRKSSDNSADNIEVELDV